MFAFEDIVRLDDRSIQKVLEKADSQRLALALKGASPSCSERIFSSLSNNAAIMLKEDMEYMGPVRIGDVKAAREEILSIVRTLEEGGEIIISSEEPGEGLIQ
jgi:flagellar motor switch protein FliG